MNKIEFKNENREGWAKNTDYWLNNSLRQVEDTKHFFIQKLSDLVKPGMTIIDMGCGNGWVLECLIDLSIPFIYIGLDFNSKFIDYLNEKYNSMTNVSFELIDLETDLPITLIDKADIVFNCFNFFETANIDVAFNNASLMMKKRGKLIILTIDCTFLILALSQNMDDFKDNLKIYEEIKSTGETPYFFQKIDLGDAESFDLKYASVLYSLNDFYKKAVSLGLNLVDYSEIIRTSKFLPKTYQYIVFQ